MQFPDNLRYSQSHEWLLLLDDGSIKVGITEHAQDQLGDVVFVETPVIDTVCEAEDAIAVVESVKAASDIYAPIAGTIADANANLGDNPELINDSPYEDGWIFRLTPNDADDMQQLMDADAYATFIENT